MNIKGYFLQLVLFMGYKYAECEWCTSVVRLKSKHAVRARGKSTAGTRICRDNEETTIKEQY